MAAKINRKNVTTTTVKSWTRVCSKHFVTGKPADLFEEDHPDWVPSVNMGYDCKGGSMTRFQRTKKREEVKRCDHVTHAVEEETHMEAVVSEENHDTADSDIDTPSVCLEKGCHALKVLLSQLHLEIKALQDEKKKLIEEKQALSNEKKALSDEVQALRDENFELRKKLGSCTFSEDTFRDNDIRVKYYTGLPNFLMLMALVNYLAPVVSSGPRSATTKFQEIMIVLMRLRLNLSVQVLADIFLVSPSTVSRIFCKIIDIMYVRLDPLIVWPDRECLHRTMPREFVRCFGKKVTVIIDCFELFIETPSNLLARAQTFSAYKHHNTVKFLIGIAPQGAVTYITNGWGGRTSDKYLTENCTFLDNLLPGDMVLADRGFNIHESVGLMCAEVKIPAFTKGKKQLSAFDVEATRKIAHVRIHVERVIGNIMQKYTILDSVIPITFLSTAEGEAVTMLDKVVKVCCALVNMCPSVVPFE